MNHFTKHSIYDMNLQELREALRWLQDNIQHAKPDSEAEWDIIRYNADVCARIEQLEKLERK